MLDVYDDKTSADDAGAATLKGSNQEKPPVAPISTRRKVIGFLLTVILLPILFVGTCVPIGLGMFAIPSFKSDTSTAVFVYMILFFAFVCGLAIKTKNIGVRWGIAFLVVAIAVSFFLANFL